MRLLLLLFLVNNIYKNMEKNVFITLREIWTEVSQPQGVSMSKAT